MLNLRGDLFFTRIVFRSFWHSVAVKNINDVLQELAGSVFRIEVIKEMHNIGYVSKVYTFLQIPKK
jgi:hypothetical protein